MPDFSLTPHPPLPPAGEGAQKILILGGTAEGAALARRLAAHTQVITSFAGRVRDLPALPGQVRVGGFGGAEGLEEFLRQERITRVYDATHPFAARISAHARQACARLGLPLERIRREDWQRRPGDRWFWAEDMKMAARMAPTLGRRILLTVGRNSLAPFARHGGPHYVARLVDPPTARLGFPWLEILLGRGPFRLQEELALLRRFRIDLLVSKASGGKATEAKLTAARMLGIPVLLVRRPSLDAKGR